MSLSVVGAINANTISFIYYDIFLEAKIYRNGYLQTFDITYSWKRLLRWKNNSTL